MKKLTLASSSNDLTNRLQGEYYTYTNRVVRHALLCGKTVEHDYDHRRQCLMNKLQEMSSIFAIQVIGCTVLPRYYQVVVRVDSASANQWPATEVARRWGMIYRVPNLLQRKLTGQINANEEEAAETLLEQYRLRLSNLSWFMRCVHEPLAKIANKEDGCSGPFWEGKVRPKLLKNQRAVDQAIADLFAPYGISITVNN